MRKAPYNRLRDHADVVQPGDWEIIMTEPKTELRAWPGGRP